MLSDSRPWKQEYTMFIVITFLLGNVQEDCSCANIFCRFWLDGDN